MPTGDPVVPEPEDHPRPPPAPSLHLSRRREPPDDDDQGQGARAHAHEPPDLRQAIEPDLAPAGGGLVVHQPAPGAARLRAGGGVWADVLGPHGVRLLAHAHLSRGEPGGAGAQALG